MSIELNHTIVPASDPIASAQFLAGILGLTVSPSVAHFTPVTLGNGVTLDYDRSDDVAEHHYAFLVDGGEFDESFGRIKAAGLTYYADPGCEQDGEIYRSKAGLQGVYFRDPDGHLMEIMTPGRRP
jgi:catechol 2,3-dioxygenase-like lactoylglutathione lyase family enzyme